MSQGQVFLSAVSSEFGIARSGLASDLRARDYVVRVQEDFRQEAGAATTLDKLHHYIERCDRVVAIMGARSGAMPSAAEAEPYRHMLPEGIAEASYTQWEILVARHHRRRITFYVAGEAWAPDKPEPTSPDRPELQAALRQHLFVASGLDRKEGFATLDALCRQVLREDWHPPPGKPIHPRFRTIGSLFKGREGVMERLRQSLTRGGHAAITGKPQALHGLGGIGKTRLALEYGLAHAEDYSALLFVTGETPEALRANLAGLTGVLGLDAEEAQDDARIAAVLAWLAEHKGWFLVLDNLDTPEALAAAEAMLARLAGGHTVLTSRLSNFSALFQPLELDVLGLEDAAAFLLERTEGRRRGAPDDVIHARAISNDLDGLALALEQAGAYIAKYYRSMARYREEWVANRDKVLSWFDSSVTDYPRSVAVTWQTSVAQLSAGALRLLQRLAFLAPEPVPEFLAEVSIPGIKGEGLDAELAELASHSLVAHITDRPFFTVHRLVQDVTARSLEQPGRNVVLHETLSWIDAAFSGDPQDVRSWPRLRPLALHAVAILEWAKAAGPSAVWSSLANQAARLFQNTARHGEAEPLMRRALSIDEARYGVEHPRVAILLNNLAQLLQDTNRLAEAEPLMRRALSIDEASYGADHPEVATRLNNLASLLYATNRLSEAEPLMRRALSIDEASYGVKHPKVAIRLNNLAQLLKATDRLSDAEPLMRRALSIDEASYGADHPEVATRLSNLASLLYATNRSSEAEPLMRRALLIDEVSYGAEHPSVAILLNNLAQLLKATNRLSEAEPLMRRVVEIFVTFTRATGHPHPHLLVAFGNYHALLRATGRDEAQIGAAIASLMAPIMDILQARFGSDEAPDPNA